MTPLLNGVRLAGGMKYWRTIKVNKKNKYSLSEEIRLYICTKLLGLILKIVPVTTAEGVNLIHHIKDYCNSVLLENYDDYMEEIEARTNKILGRW